MMLIELFLFVYKEAAATNAVIDVSATAQPDNLLLSNGTNMRGAAAGGGSVVGAVGGGGGGGGVGASYFSDRLSDVRLLRDSSSETSARSFRRNRAQEESSSSEGLDDDDDDDHVQRPCYFCEEFHDDCVYCTRANAIDTNVFFSLLFFIRLYLLYNFYIFICYS